MKKPPPQLFDRAALAAHRARAARAPAEFLHREAAAQVAERLLEVNRRFKRPAIIGPQAPLWRDVLVSGGAINGAELIADEAVLALEPGAHDLVIHALALHWAEDPVGQLVQMRRALGPDGLMIAALFGGRSLSELRACLAEAEADISGGISPRVAPMGEIRDLGALLQRAGFALPVADSTTLTITYADAYALMRDLRAMGETNALAGRLRSPTPRALFPATAALYAAHYPADAPGRVRATAEIVYLTGWCPSQSQPRPLRPGSAQARLADALGAEEFSAGEKPPRGAGGN